MVLYRLYLFFSNPVGGWKITRARLWGKSAALGLVFLLLFSATAVSGLTAVAQDDDPPIKYDPTSVSLSLYASGGASSFNLDIAIDWGGVTAKRPVYTGMGVKSVNPADGVDSFTFDFDPETFTLGIDATQTVKVTVSAKAGTTEGTYTYKIVANDLDNGTPVIGEAAGCHVYITVLKAPTPTTTPPTPKLTPTPPPAERRCFIATAAYGTSTAAEIDTLRAIRDRVLLQDSLGSQLVALYYEVSPPLADFVSKHEALRIVVRELLVDPLVWAVDATEPLWRNWGR